ncbi:MAG: hypothetical protein CNLJKLNK_00500 [Holosporales bacterium]
MDKKVIFALAMLQGTFCMAASVHPLAMEAQEQSLSLFDRFIKDFRYADSNSKQITAENLKFFKENGRLNDDMFITLSAKANDVIIHAFKEYAKDKLSPNEQYLLDVMINAPHFGKLKKINAVGIHQLIGKGTDFLTFFKSIPHQLATEIYFKAGFYLDLFLLLNEMDIDGEMQGRCLRMINAPETKTVYATMIETGKISVDFKGKPFEENERYAVAAALFREANTPDAKNNYALMIKDGKISVDYNNQPFEEHQRYAVAAALFREANTPDAKNNYALMLENGKISVDFKGKPFEENQRCAVAAALYREVNTPDAKNNYARMIENGMICAN